MILQALVTVLLGLLTVGVVDRSQPKVVELKVTTNDNRHALGSGAYVNSHGLVLTCAHVVVNTKSVVVESANGGRSVGYLVKIDTVTDLALVQTFPTHDVPYFAIGKQPRIGQQVLSMGSPLGFYATVTSGIVENINISRARYTVHGATINPGNSGGPLVSLDGRLVGVNSSAWMLNIIVPAQSLGNAVNVAEIERILRD